MGDAPGYALSESPGRAKTGLERRPRAPVLARLKDLASPVMARDPTDSPDWEGSPQWLKPLFALGSGNKHNRGPYRSAYLHGRLM